MSPLPGPVAWLTGEYPRATDTFIQREVAALRDLGFTVETCSIRRTGAQHIVGPEQAAEQAATFHVLAATARPLTSLRAHARALRRPGRYFRTLALAWRTAPKGVRGRLYNLIYFAESVVLADHLARTGAVHLHNHIAKASCTVAMLASAISGIPYSFTLHGPDIFFAPEHWRLDTKIARAAFVACISDFARSQAMLFSAPAHWEKLHVVHCGIVPDRYGAAVPGAGNRLVFVGRLAAVKGVPVLLQALAAARLERPDLHLTLIGDGPERPAIEAAARDHGLADAVTFAGYRSQAEVALALAQADMLVLPSFAEGVPVVLMEAMAARLPVIATRVGGVGELVAEGAAGILVPPGDADGLSRAILRLAGDGGLRAQMGAAGRETVCHDFDIAQEAARLAILLIAAQTGAPRPTKRPGATA